MKISGVLRTHLIEFRRFSDALRANCHTVTDISKPKRVVASLSENKRLRESFFISFFPLWGNWDWGGGKGGAVQKFAGGRKIFWTATAHAHKKKEKGEIEKKLTYVRQITYVKHDYKSYVYT